MAGYSQNDVTEQDEMLDLSLTSLVLRCVYFLRPGNTCAHLSLSHWPHVNLNMCPTETFESCSSTALLPPHSLLRSIWFFSSLQIETSHQNVAWPCRWTAEDCFSTFRTSASRLSCRFITNFVEDSTSSGPIFFLFECLFQLLYSYLLFF